MSHDRSGGSVPGVGASPTPPLPRLAHQRRRHPSPHRMSDDLAGKHILNAREIQPEGGRRPLFRASHMSIVINGYLLFRFFRDQSNP